MNGKYTRIRCGRLYDGVTEEWKNDQQILVEDDRIVAVGSSVPVPEGTDEIDLSAYQVTPGLIDAHMHMDFLDWHTIREEVYSTSEEAKTLAIARCAKKRCCEALQRFAMWAASPARVTVCWMLSGQSRQGIWKERVS